MADVSQGVASFLLTGFLVNIPVFQLSQGPQAWGWSPTLPSLAWPSTVSSYNLSPMEPSPLAPHCPESRAAPCWGTGAFTDHLPHPPQPPQLPSPGTHTSAPRASAHPPLSLGSLPLLPARGMSVLPQTQPTCALRSLPRPVAPSPLACTGLPPAIALAGGDSCVTLSPCTLSPSRAGNLWDGPARPSASMRPGWVTLGWLVGRLAELKRIKR